MSDLSKEEKIKAENDAKLKIKESIAKRKEEARKKKEEEDRIKAELLAKEEEEKLEVERKLKEKLRLAKEETRKKKEEKERETLKKKEEERLKELEAEKTNSERIKRHKEEIQRKKKEEEERIAKEKQAEKDAIANAQSSMKEKIKARKEEARKRREEEEKLKKEKEQEELEKRKKEMAERKKKRMEELAAQKAEKERLKKEKHLKEQEEQKRKEEERKKLQEKRREELLKQKAEEEEKERKEKEELEKKRKILEEEQKLAMKRHMEEVKKQKKEEENLEEQERIKLEEQRAKEFEEEQEKRKKEMEKVIKEEEERQKKLEEKMKTLGHKGPVNRCGLFSVFGEEPGLEIWVLGDQQISKIAKKKHGLRGLIGESHGSFHVERTYIILHTSFSSGLYHYRIHAWIGNEASEEMKKQAEERLSELEQGLMLYDIEVITREYKDEESDEFRAYFDKPIEYVESVSLKTTTGPNYLDKSLYRIKGRNLVRCKRIDPIPENLNSGDVFVLEDSFGIYQFNGRKSNKMERGKALDLGVQLRIERNARVRVHIIDEGNPQCEHENNKFWAALLLDRDDNGEFILPDNMKKDDNAAFGATPTGLEVPIKTPEEAGDDNEFEVAYISSWKMYEISPNKIPEDNIPSEDIEVSLHSVEMTPKGPTVSQLNDWNVVVLDCDTEIFVWYGNFSSQKARKMARTKAKQLYDEPTRDPCTIITKIRQQTETYMFKEKFVGSWGEYADFDFTEEHIRGNIANLVQEDINIDCMYYPEKYANASEDRILPIPNKDDSIKSTTEIYLVTEHDKIELSKEEYGIFYSGNCYLMLYELHYGVDHAGNDKSRHIVYFWQGWHASREDKGLSALLAGDVAKKLRFCQVVRVIQNKEPDHFLSHFSPSMLVCLGKRGKKVEPYFGKRLYHIRGTNELNVNACETIPHSSNLNTNDSFVLINEGNTFIWHGKGANKYEKLAAEQIAKNANVEIFEVSEGNEGEAFWEILGGKQDYVSGNEFQTKDIFGILFECTNTIGVFKVYRLEEFSQQDLVSKNCIILDGGHKVFVWIGSDSNDKCQSMTIDTAKKYIEFSSDEHKKRPKCDISIVKAGEEPLDFQAYFHTWDIKSANESRDTYQSKINALRETHTLASPLPQRRKKK